MSLDETPRGCFGKIAYGTRAEAVTAKRRVLARRGECATLNAYHCAECGGFHLGRDSRRRGPEHRPFIDKNAKVRRYWQLVREGV